MTEALELAIYLQRKLKHATDSCLSRNTCFRELNYARSEETRIQRELVLLKKRGQHIDPNITKQKRNLRTLHLINLRRDQTQLMDQITYYTRVAKVVNNSIPLIKQVYLEGAKDIKSTFTDEDNKKKVTDELTKLKTAKTKCAEIASIAAISTLFWFNSQQTTDSDGVDTAASTGQGDATSSDTNELPSSSASTGNKSIVIENTDKKEAEPSPEVKDGSDTNELPNSSANTGNKSSFIENTDKKEPEPSAEVEDGSESSIDDQSNMKSGFQEIEYTRFWKSDTCPAEHYGDLVGRVDHKTIDQAEMKYNKLRSEIERISSTGALSQPDVGHTGIKIATGLAYLLFGTTLTATGVGGGFGMISATFGSAMLGQAFS